MILNPMWIAGGFTTADWTGESNQESARYGHAGSTAGDVNGDGYADVIVGAPYYDSGGRVDVYHGSAAGLAAAPVWTFFGVGNQYGYDAGVSVAGAGDVNGDGFDDVIVGSALGQDYDFLIGRASVFHGSAVGLDMAAAWITEGSHTYDALGIFDTYGSSVATAGDVNADGFDDVIVGDDWYNEDSGAEEGAAFVYHGSATGLSPSPAWIGYAGQTGSEYGHDVATAGDVNGDGFADVIVGALLHDTYTATDGGRAYVYLGSTAGTKNVAAWTMESTNQDGATISDVASAGDVNGDGFDDVIIGAAGYDNGHTDEGRSYIYLGSATGLDTSAVWISEANETSAYYGATVGPSGDVNNDGYDDFAVGSPSYENGTAAEGAVFVFLGSATGPGTAADAVLDSNQAGAQYGATVGTAGDINDDGNDDLLVGAPFYDNGELDEGRAFVYHGVCSDPIDSDGDLVGDQCDVCPTLYDPMQEDDDGDGIGNVCDPCAATSPDVDMDGFCKAEDCDDNNPTMYPGAEELCDGLDNDCTDAVPPDELDEDGDGEPICAGDCDDNNPDLFSGNSETCNGFDDNCDGALSPEEVDSDRDHFSICDGDCDDGTTKVGPGLGEICGDSLDNDCDGVIDQSCKGEATGCTCNATGSAGAPLLAFVLLLRVTRRRI